MIISASRRTDIPGYYSEWFLNRIKEGYLYVRNPFNARQVSKVNLSPDAVDSLVFWTKNPAPMLGRLGELKNYFYYFLFTLNPYDQDLEPHLPPKDRLVDTFRRLAGMLGPDRVIWRYDPIVLNKKYTVDYHVQHFVRLAGLLQGCTKTCTISFLDFYRKIAGNVRELGLQPLVTEDRRRLAESCAEIGAASGVKIVCCAEDIDLSDLNITPACCIDAGLVEKMTGRKLKVKKDRNQRRECGCAASTDIGMYNTCPSGCKYCYANYSARSVQKNIRLYDPASPLLCSRVESWDVTAANTLNLPVISG
jgi:hypothetical protein